MKKNYFFIFALFLIYSFGHSQNIGDFQSKNIAASLWNDASSWETWNGSTWDATSSYPGQNTGLYTITILDNTTITIPSNLSTTSIGTLIIGGTLILGDGTSNQHITTLSTKLLTIKPTGALTFSGPKVRLTLPASDAVLIIEPSGTINGSCTNNDELFIDTSKYASCVGSGTNTYSFGDLIAAGGSLNAKITSPVTNPTDISGCTLINLTGGYDGIENNVTYQWKVRDPNGLTTIINSGSLVDNTISTSTSFTPNLLGEYLVSLEITTTSLATNVETRTFNIIDTTNPTITAPANITATTNIACTATGIALGTPTTSDNCSVASVTNNAPAAFPLGSTTVTWTVTDGSGRTATATQTVTVTDNINPTISAPANITTTTNTNCTATGVALGTPTTADNCFVASVTNNAPAFFPLGSTTVIWTVTDAAGNSATANQTVTVTDNIVPTISAPANIATTTNTACTATGVALGTPTTGDNCSVASVTNNHSSTTYPLGSTTVIWTVTDAAGNSATANQTVTVTDNVNPTITAPAAINTTTNTACTATSVALGTPTTSDNCSVATVTNNHPSTTYPLGSTTVIWTVTDAAGNSATANQTVTITDNVNPTISAPANITTTTNTACTATGVALGTPTTGDNCSVASVTNNAPAAFPLGSTTVTWTVTDGSGRTATATQTVTVTDNVNPTISAPANITTTTNTACIATGVALGTPTTADNCSVATVINNHPSTTYPLGSTTVIWRVTDAAGNSATANQTVTVTDNVNPTITAPANITTTTNTACTATSVALGTPTTSDNCSVASVTNNHPSTTYPLGSTTVIWTVTDAAGNSATANQTVTVTDNINPTITAPVAINTTTNTACTATGVVLGTPTTGDNCSVASVTNNHPSTTYPLGSTTVIWTVTDTAGNSATANQTVTVTDNVNPTITAPAAVNTTTNTACTATGVALGTPTTADNCSVASVTNNAPAAFPLGSTTVTWTVTDGSGRTATATQTVTITDNVNPTISCPTNISQNVVAGTCTASVITPNPTTADNCGVTKLTWTLTGATIASSLATGINNLGTRVFNLGTTTVTYTVSDAANNSVSCSFTVTITDNINPTITCPTNMTANTSASCTASIITPNPTTADNCGVTKLTWTLTGATIASSAVTGINNIGTRVFNLGTTTVTYTVSDAANNTATCSYTVTVTDNINPTITCSANLETNIDAGTCTASVVTPNPTIADNCAVTKLTWALTGATVANSPTTGINNLGTQVFNRGLTTVTYIASDAANNTATCSYIMEVEDNINPTITCSASISQNVGAGSCTKSIATSSPTTADNCAVTKLTWTLTGVTTANSLATGINNLGTQIFNLGVTTVTYIASDAENNTATCSYTVTVTDNINPTITCSASISQNVGAGSCTKSIATSAPTTADNCGVTKLTWTLTGATVASSAATGINNIGTRVFNLGITTATYRVEDAAGNFTTCSFTVTVTDNINPTITAPAAINITTNTACTATSVALGTPTTADNCSVASVTNNAPAAFPLGSTTVTWTVTDGSGRTATATQTVTVTDNVNPTINCPTNISQNVGAGTCTANVVTLNPTTADNCGVTKLTWALTGATIASSAATGINNIGTRVFNLGTTTVTYTVSDAANNSVSCSFTVTITDNINPTITCPTNMTANTSASCTASVITPNPTTADNCGVTKLTWALTGATVSSSAVTGINNLGTRVFNLGITTVTYRVEDAAGNFTTCSFTVTVTDNINPTITAPATVNTTTNTACTATGVALGTPTTADNCSIASVTNNAPAAFPLGSTTVTWTVTDGSGRTATATQTVTVTDNVIPTISCPANISQNVGAGTCTANVVTLNPTTADNCGVTKLTWTLTGATIASSVVTGINNIGTRVFNLGTTTVTYTVSDAANNSVSCSFTVTITDNINPTITCPTNMTANTSASCTASVITPNPTTADNCSVTKLTWTLTGATVASSAVTGINTLGTRTFNLGITTATYRVEDAAGNFTTCSFTVTVTDNIAPTVTLSNVTAQCSVTLTAPTASDNCAGTVTGTTNDAITYNAQGTFMVTWAFNDGNGNVTTRTQNVIIDDTVAPVANLASLPTLNMSGCQIDTLTPPTATDTCKGTINGTTTTTFPITTQGTTVVTWTYDDGNGNTTSQTQNIILTAPPISGGTLAGYISGLVPAMTPSDNIAITSCPDEVNPITMNLSNQIGTIVRWEKFEAGDSAWNVIANTTNSYNITFNFSNTKSTLFRVLIQVENCTRYSNIVNVHAIPPDVPPILDQNYFNICLNNPVTLVARSGYTSTVEVGDGGDFNSGQFPDKWDPTQWKIDGEVAGAQWTAAGNNTKFNNWSGTNNHPVGTLYRIEYNSNDLKFGIAHGNFNSAAYISEFGVGPTTLETQIFSLVGLKTAAIQFDQAYNLHAGDYAKLELSLDGGSSYTVVLQNLIGTSPQATSWAPVPYPYQAPKSNNSTTTYFNFQNDNSSFDLSEYIGNDNVRVKWTFFGTTDESAWAIDNITIPVKPYSDVIEWTDGLGTPGEYIIRDQLAAAYTFTPSAPGVHLYGATSLINGCRAYDPDGTAIATVRVNYAYAGEAMGYTNAECGERTVQLNAYDNTKSADLNKANGAYPLALNTYSDDPGTGETGKWSVFLATNTCGTYSFSNISSPTSSFSGDAGVYTLRWKLDVSGCYSDVQVTLTNCSVVDFDGVDDYVTFKNNYGLGTDFSIEIWVKPDPQPANPLSNIQTILSKRNANNPIDGYDLRLTGSILSFNWNNESQIVSPFPLTTNRWYHVAIIRNSGIYRLYVDGIEVANAAGSAPISNNSDCILGAMNQTGNASNKPVNHFSGWLDELRIWNTGLNSEHLRQMMNQQIVNNGTAVKGEIVPLDINGPDTNKDGVDDQQLLWANLIGYYRMNQIDCGYLKPFGGKGVDGKLRNTTSSQEETAPLPYISIRDGNWTDRSAGTTPWKYGDSVWDYPNSTGYNGTPIDWNIVQTAHNINSGNKDITVLGLISTTGKLTIADPVVTSPIENNDGQGLWITHYLKLNGTIDLVGESQLIQKRYIPNQFTESILDVTSSGYLERDQQGKRNSFNYNYWSSPVSNIQGIINNTTYSPASVLKDGTISSTPKNITFGDGAYFADGTLSSPILTSNRWIWSYNSKTLDTNTELQDYFQWNYVGNAGLLKTGEGFTMKGTGGIAAIDVTQNYVFVGKPNNGNIALSLAYDQTYLVGNPYPSALDADEFILDNLAGRAGVNVFNGTLYFWDHFGLSNNHYLAEYEGGYATYTLIGGVKAIGTSSLTAGGAGSKVPQRYIPVGQGFFVDAYIDPALSGTAATVSGGTLNFKNSQRAFMRESTPNSVFMKKRETKTAIATKPKIRLGFDSSVGAHRQLLIGVDSNATNSFDMGYDAPMFDTNENDMYWIINDSQFVIQGVPDFNTNRIIPLGLVIANEGEITIKIDELENVPSSTKIYLHDAETAIYHDLKNSNYKITLPAGNYDNRFSLTFENLTPEIALDVTENDLNDGIIVLYSSNYKILIIKNNIPDTTVNSVSLYNMLGQFLSNWDVKDKEQTNIQIPIKNLPSGIYIVKIKTSKGESSKKIIVN